MIVRRTLEICNQLVTEQAPETIRKLGTETKHPNLFWQSQRAALDKGLIVQINAPLRAHFGRCGPGAGELFGSRAIPQAKPRTSETPNSPPAPGPHRDTKKSARALDGFGCPTEAPYGCFLPDLTRFGTCRHPNPSNALGTRYILPAPARWGKVANFGRGI